MKTILVTMPNIGETEVNVETVRSWTLDDIEIIGDRAFFTTNTVGGPTRCSMNKTDFLNFLDNK